MYSPALLKAVDEDFRNFLYLMWKFLRLPDPTPVQYDVAHYLQHGPRRRMAKAFRGAGKSWETAGYALWRLKKNPNERILVVSASKDRADAFTTFTRRLINEWPLLQHLRPRKGQRDSVIAFDVGPSDPHQAPSVRSVGITGQMTGGRATIIIADDVETPSNSLTQLMRERLGESVKEFDAILSPGGEIIYLGTDQTEMSLYKQLPARGYDVRVWPARIPLDDKLEAYGDTLAPFVHDRIARGAKPWDPVDPQRFDEADLLEREASYGRSGFALQFMLDPSLSDAERYPLRTKDLILTDLDGTVGPEVITWSGSPANTVQGLQSVGLTGDRWQAPMFVDIARMSEWTQTVMFIDPSGRGKDETGYSIVSAHAGRLFLRANGGFKGGYEDETLMGLVQVARRHEVKLVLIEPNFGDGMFRRLIAPVFTKHYPCRLEDAPWARTQKEARIIDTLEPIMQAHRLVVDRGLVERDTKAPRDYQLFYQMTRLTRERDALRHDDRLESLAGACAYFAELMSWDSEGAAEALEEERKDKALEEFLESCDAAGIGPASRGNAARDRDWNRLW